MKTLYGLVLVTILLLACAPTSVLAQGGTGKLPLPPPPKRDPRPIFKMPSPVPPPVLCSGRSPRQATGRTHAANLPGGAKLELVEIPAGSFCMGADDGAPDERPAHKVTIRQPFYIGKYEVTQEQWQALLGNNPSNFKACGGCPVEQVSWDDAQRFIAKLNELNNGFAYRLPSEAEWEYAARAGTTDDYAGNLSAMAWYDLNAGNKSHPVGEKQANSFGLYDTHGNVNEWCEDWYHLNLAYRGAPTDGSVWEARGEQRSRVLRGGSWRNPAGNQRLSARGKSEPGARLSVVGFRVVAIPRR